MLTYFEYVFMRRTNPIRLNKLFVQLDDSTSMLPTISGYFDIRALAAALAKLDDTRASLNDRMVQQCYHFYVRNRQS